MSTDFGTAVSRDGTVIAYERAGSGPAVIGVGGAFCDRSFAGPLAGLLQRDFTVVTYDRRGRGDSGDTLPYAVSREIEDLEAVIAATGGPAPGRRTARAWNGWHAGSSRRSATGTWCCRRRCCSSWPSSRFAHATGSWCWAGGAWRERPLDGGA